MVEYSLRLSFAMSRKPAGRGKAVCSGMVEFDRRKWFAQQILVHESQLRGYLRRFLKSRCDVADGVQETYARLLGLSDTALAAIRHPHAFLFTAARNVALEWKRREHRVYRGLVAEPAVSVFLWDDGPSAYEELRVREELALLARAIAALPQRCRQVVTLRKLHGVPQKQIAAQLGISENTVEKHAANGVRLCASYIESWHDQAGRSLWPVPRRAEPEGSRRAARDSSERENGQARRARRDASRASSLETLARIGRAR